MPSKREFYFKSGYGTSWNGNEAFDDLYGYYLSYGDKFFNKLSVFLSYGRKETNGFPYQYNVQSLQPPASITGWQSTTDNTGKPRYLIGDKGDGYSWYDDITVKTQYDFSDKTKARFTFMRNNYRTYYDPPNTFLRDSSGNPAFRITRSFWTEKRSRSLAF